MSIFCRVFIDERKTQQNRQERRREKVKKSHESQMSELKRYVQNVRITIFKKPIALNCNFSLYQLHN